MSEFPIIYTNAPSYWPKIEFSLYLIGQILSIPCYLFVFNHILFNKTARQSLHNHSIIVLLIYNFFTVTIDISLTQNYTRLGYVTLFHPILCLIWQFVDSGIWYGGISIMLWISIERHILVFHQNLVRTSRGRFVIHYIPLFLSALYAPILYFYLIVLYPCENTYIVTSLRCGRLCYSRLIGSWFSLYDSLVDYIIPILLIVFFSLTLFLRFLKQKQKLRRTVTWRDCRKMLIQLLFISLTYVLCDLPLVIIYIIRKLFDPTFASSFTTPFMTRLTLVPAFILPYATLFALPESKQKFRNLSTINRNRQVLSVSGRAQAFNNKDTEHY